MLDSRKSNPNCSFTQDVVSYLYEEMSGSEKLNFEQHLGGCLSCAEELGAFSTVSNSIQNWRDAEIAVAVTPEISRSFYDPAHAGLDLDRRDGGSWLESLRRLFDLSPALLKTAAAFGTLAIVIGFGWIMFGGAIGGSNDLANTQKQDPKPVIEKGNAAENQTERASSDETDSPGIADSTEGESMESSPGADASENQTVSSSQKKTIRNNRRSTRSGNRVNNSSKITPPNTKQNNVKPPVFREAPRLTDEVAIDDSEELRLSDIFSEIGS